MYQNRSLSSSFETGILKLKDELRKLSAKNREQLMLAFEAGFADHVVVRDDVFVGVHLAPSERFAVVETNGTWSCGHVR